MNVLEYMKTAFLTLRQQKVRSLLTTLGIVVGVMTVVTMISIVEGMNRFVYQILGTMGSNVIYAQKHKWIIGTEGAEDRDEERKRKDLTLGDADAIAELDCISNTAPFRTKWAGQWKASYRGEEVKLSTIEGVGLHYASIAGYEVEQGRELVENDITFRRQVCLIGTYIAENLFTRGEDPVGKEIYIRGRKFQIAGLLKERGSFLGQNLDVAVLIPLTTLEKVFLVKRWMRYYPLSIMCQVKQGVSVATADERIEELLRTRRGLRFDQENDFALNTQQMIVVAYKKLTTGIFMAMIGIASLALLVGGIGIMNIMLVSVLERIREIGVRIAVGARRKDILRQFLIEALVLTSVGGFIGVFLGFGLAKLISLLTPLPSSMPLWSVALAVGFSLLTGLFFGIYPASRASRLDPIEALRYE